MMTTLMKALTGGAAAAALLAGAAAPVAAQERGRDRDRDGISAGEVIAGAVVLGGLAAIIAGADDDRYYDDYRYGRDYGRDYDRGYDRRGYAGGNARAAVERCVNEAERVARRQTGARAEVYEIRDIQRERNGFEIRGRIAVRNDYRGRGYRDDYRYGLRNAGWDEGRFTCEVRRGRVVDLGFGGLRGL